MATLTISRAHEFTNRFRSYQILINGQQTTTLGHNENKTLNLPAGTYTLKAKIDWVSSQEHTVTLDENNTQQLEIGCSIQTSIVQKMLTLLGFIILFGSILTFDTITLETWAILLVLWLIRDVLLTKGKSFLYYLGPGRTTYLYIKPLTPAVSQ